MPDIAAHHTGITVSDLDRAVAFYRDVLGLSVVDRFEVDGEAFATAVDVEDAVGSFAHLDAGGTRLELVEYDPAADHRAGADLNQPGATHIGMSVDDVDEFAAGLPDDVETLSGPRTTDTGTRLVFLRGPDGTLVELLEA